MTSIKYSQQYMKKVYWLMNRYIVQPAMQGEGVLTNVPGQKAVKNTGKKCID